MTDSIRNFTGRRTHEDAPPPLCQLIAKALTRRQVLGAALAGATLAGTGLSPRPGAAQEEGEGSAAGRFVFPEISRGIDRHDHWPPGYSAKVLIRWGDPLLPDAPDFEPHAQSPAAQAAQFGYNNDYTAFFPLPGFESGELQKGLLCVNHENTTGRLMLPPERWADRSYAGRTWRVAMEQAAIGCSVVEVVREGADWRYLRKSPFNRRITAGGTYCAISGPAAGHARLKTNADVTGRRVIGTLANCAGGVTPWGTYLSAEENFHEFFNGRRFKSHPEFDNYRRLGIPRGGKWGIVDPRFNVNAAPNEANRFGWVVEIDPYDPQSLPVKRTALGRFKHEGAETALSADGRLVVYMGDDEAFEHLYKFVSNAKVDPEHAAANRDLLDDGILYVARFHEDGHLEWLPLVQGAAPLDGARGFESQADVLIETRRAAELMGATPMDRPEDVQPNPHNGRVYVALTANPQRTASAAGAANPRAVNHFGHIIELAEADGDFASREGRWDILVLCGDPAAAKSGARWNEATSAHGWFANPDNLAVDALGRLWVCSDQGMRVARTGTADGLWALETEGSLRGMGRLFYRVPVGAELCGPSFTPDSRSLFLAVQHVAAAPAGLLPGFDRPSTFKDPATRWPDFQPGMPPRPSIVVITESKDRIIAS